MPGEDDEFHGAFGESMDTVSLIIDSFAVLMTFITAILVIRAIGEAGEKLAVKLRKKFWGE